MSKNVDHQKELLKALNSLYKFVTLLYSQYTIYFKVALLLLLIYFFYKLGKYFKQQQIDKMAKSLAKMISQDLKVRNQVPKKRDSIIRTKKISKILLTVVMICLVIAYYLQLLPIFYIKMLVIGCITISIITLVYIKISEYIQNKKTSSLYQNEQKIIQETQKFSEYLGDRVLTNMKAYLCRDTLLKTFKPKSNNCEKNKCQNQRSLKFEYYKAIKTFVEKVIGFQWCSICQTRKPFDELLGFKKLPPFKGENQNPQLQVNNRLKYLQDGINQKIEWINSATPCNCSKLYWEKSINQRTTFNKNQKEINIKMENISNNQQRSLVNTMIYRNR